MPLQVWSGPLANGAVAVVLLNAGNGTHNITATWSDIGVKGGSNVTMSVTDLWTGKVVDTAAMGSITASVSTHDSAAYTLTPA
jgi:hypothetical protein